MEMKEKLKAIIEPTLKKYGKDITKDFESTKNNHAQQIMSLYLMFKSCPEMVTLSLLDLELEKWLKEKGLSYERSFV